MKGNHAMRSVKYYVGLAAAISLTLCAPLHAASTGFIFPGGANPSSTFNASGTSLDGMTVLQLGQTLDKIAANSAAAVATADDAIPKGAIGAASGVAGLSTTQTLTNDVESANVLGTATVNSGAMPITPTWAFTGWLDPAGHMAGPRVTTETPKIDMNGQIADHLMSVGGHQLYDSVFSKFYALPYGVGDKGGCVLSINMTAAPGTAANCGAGGWDAVTVYELAANNIPWYMTGASITDETGATHSVTFTANSAIVRPVLPSGYKQQMHVGMHVLTNIVAGPTIYGGPSIDGVNTHRNQDQQFYGNMLNTWEDGTDSTGSYTEFDMSGQWQPVSGTAVDVGHVPSTGSSNTTAVKDSSGNVTNAADSSRVDSLDQVQYAEFTQPILVFGTYIKHFTRNTSCEVIIKDGTDGSAASRFGASRKCDEELDNWYHGPDYGATMHGLTIGAGFDNKVSQDSYGLAVAGAWPAGARIWLGSDGIDFDGDAYVTGARKGADPAVGNKKLMAEWFQEPSADIGYLEQVVMWSQIDSLSSANGTAANGQDISYWFGPRQSASKYNVDGDFEVATVYNPSWSKNGLALCGANAAGYIGLADAGRACLTVGTWGDVSTTGSGTFDNGITSSTGYFNGNVTIGTGKSLFLTDPTGKTSSYFYNQAGSSGAVVGLFNSAGAWQMLKADAFIGSLATPTSSSAACIAGQSQDDTNYHYVCVATNSWKRVALSSF